MVSNPAKPRPIRTWFVTGSSTGLGRALCERVLEHGDRVVCTARNVGTIAHFKSKFSDRAVTLSLDVTQPASIERAVAAALSATGGIDVVVNNAGYGIVGALEEVDEAAAKGAFDANVFGAHRVLRALLPHMRARGTGHILNISSMGGLVAGAGFGFYNATKFALEGMSESLAQEIAPFGIRVTIIEPGPFRTDFRHRSMVSTPPMEAYQQTSGKFRKMLSDTDGKQPGDPRRAAEAMIAVVEAQNPPLRLPLGEVCVQAIQKKNAAMADEMNRWMEVSLATSFLTDGSSQKAS
jgi:NAD(P)-dependent dehydrogenase (short-subunit alcohol dehydrogenase family)